MTPEDFQKQLSELPPDTPVTAEHILVMLEILKNGSKPNPVAQEPKDKNYSQWDSQKVIDQDTLAEWINESPSTLEKWRMTNNAGPQATYKKKRVGYQVGKVREWLNQNTHDSSIQHQHAKQAELQAALSGKKIKKLFSFGMEWDQVEPLIFIDNEPRPYFSTFDDELNITGYEVRWSQSESLAYWFMDQLKSYPDKAVDRLEVRGNINEMSLYLVDGEVQKRNLAHTVATIPFDSEVKYQELIFDLLYLGVDFKAVDEQGRDAVTLAEHENNGFFAKTVKSYYHYWELQDKLAKKPFKLAKKPF